MYSRYTSIVTLILLLGDGLGFRAGYNRDSGWTSYRRLMSSGISPSWTTTTSSCRSHAFVISKRSMSSLNSEDEFDGAEEAEPGTMRVAEIKAELDLRGIDYSDCFDKESLSTRLIEARATGKANPDIIQKFNKQRLEETFNEEKAKVTDEALQQAVANDGTLPGGMTPEMFKKLTSNPEVMAMLQSTKVQEAMQLMMTGGREQLEQKLKDDPALQKAIEQLNMVLRSV